MSGIALDIHQELSRMTDVVRKLERDKLELKIALYWVRGLAGGECWSVADQALSNPSCMRFLADAPDWVKGQFPTYYDKAYDGKIPVPAVPPTQPALTQCAGAAAVGCPAPPAVDSAVVSPVRTPDGAAERAFSILDPDVKFLASEAAFEIDNVRIGNSPNLKKPMLLQAMIGEVVYWDTIEKRVGIKGRKCDSATFAFLTQAVSYSGAVNQKSDGWVWTRILEDWRWMFWDDVKSPGSVVALCVIRDFFLELSKVRA